MKTKKPIQLTPALLKSIIEEEVKGFGDMEDVTKRAKDTDETDADELADAVTDKVDWKKVNHIKESDTLDEHIDLMKGYKLEEARLTKIVVEGQRAAARLSKVRDALKRGAQKLISAKIV